MNIAMERILAWKIMPRLMMLVMTLVYWRVIEFAISQEELSTQHAAIVSVVTGAMTGAFATWLGHEK